MPCLFLLNAIYECVLIVKYEVTLILTVKVFCISVNLFLMDYTKYLS